MSTRERIFAACLIVLMAIGAVAALIGKVRDDQQTEIQRAAIYEACERRNVVRRVLDHSLEVAVESRLAEAEHEAGPRREDILRAAEGFARQRRALIRSVEDVARYPGSVTADCDQIVAELLP